MELELSYQERLGNVAKKLGIDKPYLMLDSTRLMAGTTHMEPSDSLRTLLNSGATSTAARTFYRGLDLAELINMIMACKLFTQHYQDGSLEALTGLSPDRVDEYHWAIRNALTSELGSVSISSPDWMFDLLAGHMALNDITVSKEN